MFLNMQLKKKRVDAEVSVLQPTCDIRPDAFVLTFSSICQYAKNGPSILVVLKSAYTPHLRPEGRSFDH